MKIIIETLFKMSLTASVVILAVLTVRAFMRRCPKIYSYLLWVIVGIRLCIPFSFESRLSIFNLFAKAETDIQTAVSVPMADPAGQTSVDPYKLIGVIWLTGILVFTVYGIFTYYRLQHKLRVSFPMGDGVYSVEGLSSPFVMGFMNPKIYIPLGLDNETENYVLMHERTHLKRGDHLIKLFAFALLCMHWFNPFCWLAFIFMSRDMEMSCDEKVLGTGDISHDYSTALLSFAANKRFPSPGPLCFGEVSVKRRIKNILSWKKPGFWITLLSCIVCVTVFVSCAGGAVEERTPELLENKPEKLEQKTSDTQAKVSSDTTADTTTADSTSDTIVVDTTIAETATVQTSESETTTVAATTVPPETTAVTTRKETYYYPQETQTSSIITPEMEASFEQSLKELIEYQRESMRKDMEDWYEKNTTAKTTNSDQNKNSNDWSIIIFPQPGQNPGVNYP